MNLAHLGMHRTDIDRADVTYRNSIKLAIVSQSAVVVPPLVAAMVLMLALFSELALRYQMHAAFWTITWLVLSHFGVHWTRVDHSIRRVRGGEVIAVTHHNFPSL